MKSSLYYKIVLLFYQFTFCIALAMGQQIPLQPDLTEGTNFLTLQKETNSFFEENPKVKGYKQWKRKEWFLEPRLFPSGKMENLTLKTWKAYERFKKTLPDSRSTHGSWTFLGPTSNPIGMGRLNSITFNPNNNNIIYVGGSNSGVWKSGNGGTSWTNITPHIPLLAVADIELDPGNANVIYLLTGDGNPAPFEWEIHAQTEISSIGIL